MPYLKHSRPTMTQGEMEAIVYARLLAVLNVEQLALVAALVERVAERAVSNHCEQSITIVFNKHGYPRRFNGTDNLFMEMKDDPKIEEKDRGKERDTRPDRGRKDADGDRRKDRESLQ